MQAFLRSGLSLYRSRSIRLRRSISHPFEQVDLTFISVVITPLRTLHFVSIWSFYSRFLLLRPRVFRAVLHSLEHSYASRCAPSRRWPAHSMHLRFFTISPLPRVYNRVMGSEKGHP